MHRAAARLQHGVRKRSQATVTILVIEDDRFVRDVTCAILRDAGYRVLEAGCAAAARAVLLRYGKKIQLLVCDAVLPDSSGAVLAQSLRQLSPGLKIILASGYPRLEVFQAWDPESGTEFLAKPYGAASLIAKVQTVLQDDDRVPQSAQARG